MFPALLLQVLLVLVILALVFWAVSQIRWTPRFPA